MLGRLDSLDTVNLSNLVQRLARERALFEGIFETLQEGVLVVGADGIVEYANQSAQRLVGLRGDALGSATLWRLVPGLRASLENAFLADDPGAAAADDGDGTPPTVVTREFELTYPELRYVRLYMVPFHSEGRAAARRFAVILSDITRDRETTEARIEDERTSSVLLLAAGVAHELGNPLNSITIHLQLIERRLKKLGAAKDRDTGALADSIRVCQEEVVRLDGIITNFLDAIRPRPPDLAATRLEEVLAGVLQFHQRELENRGVSVEAELTTALPAVMADRNQVKQVFFNIIKNAMEAMQPGGVLRITARVDDDDVSLLFGDTGGGIPQGDLVKLFQPYHTTKTGGNGLGLMVVQRIMRDHGGQIGIESTEGVGTTVTLQFPRKDRRVRMLK
ncbi:MAG: PAS domain-containing protein [Opitutaceae bacterium]|nr:PAS domain-containing protein [Opitutaceae bacterium]